METEELVAVGDAAGVFLGELGGFCFDGVSVLFEFGDGFLGVVDFKDAVDFADWGLFFQPAGLEYDLHYVLACVFRTQFRNCGFCDTQN